MAWDLARKEILESILLRLRGRHGMNERTRRAAEAEYPVPVFTGVRAAARTAAYQNAIADVIAVAKDAGIDVE